MPQDTLAAVLIDFENVYYFLKDKSLTTGDISDLIVEMIRDLKKHLADKYCERVLSLDAYADFDRIEESAQSSLYLLGVETHNVLGTDHKNSADMRVCIDVLDIFYNRPEIHTFVLVAGDRDYIPVIQYLKKRAKTVRVVGFPKSVSGDLLTIVGTENFIDPTQFVPALNRPTDQGAMTPHKPAAFRSYLPVDDLRVDWPKYEIEAVNVIHTYFKGKPEVWLSPYLHKLRTELSELTEGERKMLVTRLRDKGVFRVEKRDGTPNDYSVIIVNWNHPLVHETYQ